MISSRQVILHATESLGGGVVTAVAAYLESTPETEHHLLYVGREVEIDEGFLGKFASVRITTKLRFRSSLKAFAKELRPTHTHLHSSWAGFLGRFPRRFSGRTSIIYSPHGYAFQRQDVSARARKIYRYLEWWMSSQCVAIALCSRYEESIAPIRGSRTRRVFVPNVVQPFSRDSYMPMPSSTKRVVTVGRLTAAKDPDFFALFSSALQKEETKCYWIGGGSASMHKQLESRGIEVTGWLSTAEARTRMAESDIYVHTAAWEGFPMTVLEACRLDLPIVARRIPVFDSPLVQGYTVDSPDEMAATVNQILSSSSAAEECRAAWRAFTSEHSPSIQRDSLLALYRLPTPGRTGLAAIARRK